MNEPSGMSRRGIVRAAAGAFTLATSGLFLPEGLVETGAREGTYGGALGGRHGPDHRGRHRRRTHGDKKDNRDSKPPQPPRREPSLGVLIYLRNYRSVPVEVEAWEAAFDDQSQWSQPNPAWFRSTIAGKPATGLPHSKTFQTDQANVAVRIGTDLVVDLEGGPPPDPRFVAILSGGWDATGWNPMGETLVVRGGMKSFDTIEAGGVRVKRNLNAMDRSFVDHWFEFEVSAI